MKLHRSVPATAAAVLAALTLPTAASAAAGDLDPSFGEGGIVRTQVGMDHARLDALAPMPGGGIAGVGSAYADPDTFRIAAARWDANGTPIASFGTGGGQVILAPARSTSETRSSQGAAVLSTANGLLAAGRQTLNSSSTGLFAALGATGALDPSFSGDGVLADGFNGFGVTDLVRDAAGRIVASGSRYGIGNSTIEIRRYTTAGALDTSFSGDGVAALPWLAGGNQDFAQALAARGDGVLAAGTAMSSGTPAFALVALREDGTLDPAFGANGAAVTPFSGRASAFDVAALPDGGWIAVGADGLDSALARYDAAGNLVPGFGTGGRVVLDLGGEDRLNAVAVDSAGRIIVTGTADERFIVARLLPDGTLDGAFGTAGVVHVGDRVGNPFGVAAGTDLLLAGDRILAGGSTGVSRRSLFTVAALQTGDAGTGAGSGAGAGGTAGAGGQGAASTGPITTVVTSRRGGVRRIRVGVRFLSARPSKGALRLQISFPAGTRGTATLQVRRRGRPTTLIATRSFTLRGTSAMTVRVPLTRAGKQLMKSRRRVAVAASLTVAGR